MSDSVASWIFQSVTYVNWIKQCPRMFWKMDEQKHCSPFHCQFSCMFLLLISSVGCTPQKSERDTYHLRRGTKACHHLIPAICISHACLPVCDTNSLVWIWSNRWASLFTKSLPRAQNCCSINSISQHILLVLVAGTLYPSLIPSSLWWTIELELAIHYMWRSLTWSSTLLLKAATSHGNFRTTASATLLICIFNAVA